MKRHLELRWSFGVISSIAIMAIVRVCEYQAWLARFLQNIGWESVNLGWRTLPASLLHPSDTQRSSQPEPHTDTPWPGPETGLHIQPELFLEICASNWEILWTRINHLIGAKLDNEVREADKLLIQTKYCKAISSCQIKFPTNMSDKVVFLINCN